MKLWQSIVVNALAAVLAVFVAIRVFPPRIPSADVREVRDTLDKRMKDMQASLTAIQDAVQKQTVIPPTPKGPATELDKLPELNQKLDMILGKLTVFEKRISDVQSACSPQNAMISPPMLSGQPRMPGPVGRENPMGWIEELSDEKRRRVDQIFEEHARRIRERLPAEPGGRLPDRETLRKVMKESDWELKEELKAVLTDEEYKRFIDSHPKMRSGDLPLPGGGPAQVQQKR